MSEVECSICNDSGQYCVGNSGSEIDGNAPILERCDCDVGLGLKTIQITECESLKADAERYRFLRNADLSVMNSPCIAVQHTEKTGTFLSGDDADKALNEAMWTPPTCDKCGAEITTGLMAAFCPNGKYCEFYVEGVEAFYPRDKSCHICNGDCSSAPSPVIGCPHSACQDHKQDEQG